MSKFAEGLQKYIEEQKITEAEGAYPFYVPADNFIEASEPPSLWDRILWAVDNIRFGFYDVASSFGLWKSLIQPNRKCVAFYREWFFEDLTDYDWRSECNEYDEDDDEGEYVGHRHDVVHSELKSTIPFDLMDPAYRYALGNVHLFSATPTRMSRYSLGFGNSEIQRGIGLPPEIANQDPEQFGRTDRIIEVDYPGFDNFNPASVEQIYELTRILEDASDDGA